jgi:hypothetical protein
VGAGIAAGAPVGVAPPELDGVGVASTGLVGPGVACGVLAGSRAGASAPAEEVWARAACAHMEIASAIAMGAIAL